MAQLNKYLFLGLSLAAFGVISCHPRVKGPVITVSADECANYGQIKQDNLPELIVREADSQVISCAIKKSSLLVPRPDKYISLAYYFLADSETDMDRRYALAKKGLTNGEWAVKDNPEDGLSNYVLAVNLGLVMQQDLIKAIGNVGKLRGSLEKAIEKIPAYDDGGAYRVLGQLYLQAPSWPASIGDPDTAVELLEKAIEVAPEHPLNQLFLADAIWESEGRDAIDEAREHFDTAQELFAKNEWQSVRGQWQVLIDKLTKKLAVKDSCK